MIKAIIIEDETYAREALKVNLSNLSSEVTILGESESVKDALLLCKATSPDLVFLDINLKDGTGFDFLDRIEEINFKIIFITAYEDYVLKALRCGAVDYILKPIDSEELAEAIQKVMTITQNQTQERMTVVKDQFIGKNDRIVLRMQDSFQIVDFEQLMYCKADSGYTTFFLSDGRKFVVSKPLKDFVSQLPAATFVRTHQSYLVNISFIDRYDKTRFLFLKNGDKIAVSIRKKESIMAKIFGGF
ncbi:MAG: two-component system LytT family response regulator [Crocinitomix sp.]|jgi:two-component system LytT family response regulator